MASVLWSENPEEGRHESDSSAEVDDSFASRRLRRWIKGMFGGEPKEDEESRGSPEAPPQDD